MVVVRVEENVITSRTHQHVRLAHHRHYTAWHFTHSHASLRSASLYADIALAMTCAHVGACDCKRSANGFPYRRWHVLKFVYIYRPFSEGVITFWA